MAPKQVDVVPNDAVASTRDELIAALAAQINVAVASKDFKQAAKLQEQHDELVLGDGAGGPSAAAAKYSSNYSESSSGTSVSVTTPDGDLKQLASRTCLEQEISVASNSVNMAVSQKNFKRAQLYQDYLDMLESRRNEFPTIRDLQTSISETSTQLERAVATKQFGQANTFQQRLDELQSKLQVQKKLLQQQPPSPPSLFNAASGTAPASLVSPSPPHKSSLNTTCTTASMSSSSSTNRKTGPLMSGPPPVRTVALKTTLSKTAASVNSYGRPVYKLRPKKPIVVQPYQTVVHVAQTIKAGWGAAALIKLDDQPGYAGVLTPHHVVDKVVARNLDPAQVAVSEIMKTKKAVRMNSSAGDALGVMLEHAHRYLPVMNDANDQLVGILDIGQCLNDAIKKLKTANESSTPSSKAAQDVVRQVAAAQAGPGAHVNNSLLTLLGSVLEQAFGDSIAPSLRSLLANKPSTVVLPTTSIRDAAIVMSRDDTSALVVEHGQLIGIVTVKDVQDAVAKEVSLEDTEVRSIMTVDPVPVSPDIDAIAALEIMQADRVHSLPVCEEDGTVLGSVDNINVIYGVGGADGWNSIFGLSMAADDQSVSSSLSGATGSKRTNARSDVVGSRPVHELRPKRPVVVEPEQSILDVAKAITRARGDAALINLSKPGHAGVLTWHHITEKVIAQRLDPATTLVSSVMKTKQAVRLNDSAADAMSTMLHHKHRYLPVMNDGNDQLVGVLDISQCLSDAIAKLEHAEKRSSKTAEDVLAEVATINGGVGLGRNLSKLQSLLGPVLEAAFGESTVPLLGRVLEGKESNIVAKDTTVEDAAILMAKHDKAALVVEEGVLIGLVTVKDIMEQAVVRELDPAQTPVSEIMTTHPQTTSPEMTAIEALQVMNQDRVSSLPVVDESGKVYGSVDCLDVVYACGGKASWRSIWDSSMNASEAHSANGSSYTRSSSKQNFKSPLTPSSKTKVPPIVEDQIRTPILMHDESISYLEDYEDGAPVPFKVACPNGMARRFRCQPRYEILRKIMGHVDLTYVDEDGDCVTITSTDCLEDAVRLSRTMGSEVVRLSVKASAKGSWKDKLSTITSNLF